MEDRTYQLITEAVNWLKNPCVIDEVKIRETLNALISIPEIKWYYNQMYVRQAHED